MKSKFNAKNEQHVQIFKNHLKNINRLNDKIKNENLRDLILLKNLIKNSLEDFPKRQIENVEKNFMSYYQPFVSKTSNERDIT
tara:strand:- start:464 stop:712 length:249 start_codon:yes stop_codon:yes gene_type:complete